MILFRYPIIISMAERFDVFPFLYLYFEQIGCGQSDNFKRGQVQGLQEDVVISTVPMDKMLIWILHLSNPWMILPIKYIAGNSVDFSFLNP